MDALEVRQIPCRSDNYVHVVRDPASGVIAIVDPADAAPVVAALDHWGWRPDLILNTHHHGDHVGGNLDLKARFGLSIIGPAGEAAKIPGLDRAVGEGDLVAVGRQTATVFDVPGHTAGHIAYWFAGAKLAFTGDTLFAAGCGRLFEGTAEEMWQSLGKLKALPPQTQIYCAHEYTAANLKFARHAEPENGAIVARAALVEERRAKGLSTVPSTLAEELATNPFLRARDAQAFAALRRAKDQFR